MQRKSGKQIDKRTADKIRKVYAEGKLSYNKIARKFGISSSQIGRIINGGAWVN